MANEKQYKTRTRFLATRGVTEYRATIDSVVGPDDVVLELGCEWGTTTALLAGRAACVVGGDISPVCVERARASHPRLRFEVLDAFDVRALLDLGLPFSRIYLDLSGLSGYRSLLDVIALLGTYASVLQPDTVVVKSGALKHFAARCTAWTGET